MFVMLSEIYSLKMRINQLLLPIYISLNFEELSHNFIIYLKVLLLIVEQQVDVHTLEQILLNL